MCVSLSVFSCYRALKCHYLSQALLLCSLLFTVSSLVPVCLAAGLSVSLSSCLFLCLYLCLSFSLCLSPCVSIFHLSICLSVPLSLSVPLLVSLSVPVSLSNSGDFFGKEPFVFLHHCVVHLHAFSPSVLGNLT